MYKKPELNLNNNKINSKVSNHKYRVSTLFYIQQQNMYPSIFIPIMGLLTDHRMTDGIHQFIITYMYYLYSITLLCAQLSLTSPISNPYLSRVGLYD